MSKSKTKNVTLDDVTAVAREYYPQPTSPHVVSAKAPEQPTKAEEPEGES